jgi:hypothetical protein
VKICIRQLNNNNKRNGTPEGRLVKARPGNLPGDSRGNFFVRQTDRQADRQTDRQTDRGTNRVNKETSPREGGWERRYFSVQLDTTPPLKEGASLNGVNFDQVRAEFRAAHAKDVRRHTCRRDRIRFVIKGLRGKKGHRGSALSSETAS